MFAHSQDGPAAPAAETQDEFVVLLVPPADDAPVAYLGVDGNVHLVIGDTDREGATDFLLDGDAARRLARKLCNAADDWDEAGGDGPLF